MQVVWLNLPLFLHVTIERQLNTAIRRWHGLEERNDVLLRQNVFRENLGVHTNTQQESYGLWANFGDEIIAGGYSAT